MILQRDARLNAAIHKYGCYYMSILFLANKYTNCEFTIGGILDTYLACVESGWMDAECYINEPDRIFGYMGLDVYYYDRHDPPYIMCQHDEIEILRFQYANWRHFVAGDGTSHIAYDPYGTSKAVRFGQLIDKRIFKIQR